MKEPAKGTRGADIEIPVTIIDQKRKILGDASGVACYDKRVTWKITNNHAKDVTITVDSFRAKVDGKHEWPFRSEEKSRIVKPGQTRDLSLPLHHTVGRKSGDHVYEYDFKIDGQTVDPELVIEWP